eukprot:Gb_20652 [translate_table: standard]
MDIMVRIHKLKQYFNQNSRDESKKRPMSLVNESQSSRSKDKKRSEQEMVVKKLCVSYMNDNNHLFSILLDEEATCSAFKASNLEIFPYNPTPNDSLLEGLCKEGLLESEKDDSKVGLVVIHTKVCESGVPTVGNMPVREIKVISGIPDQCQAGFMLENAGIFNIRWNIDADINGHWNFNNKTMIRATVIKSWALVNYSPSLSPTKVVDAYTLIGAISGFAEKLQNIFIPTVLSKTQTVLKELVPQGLDSQARQKRSWGTLPAVANSGAAGDLKPLLGSVKLDISNLVAFSRKFSLDGCNSRKSITALVELLKPMRGQQGAPPLALRPLTQIAKGNYANKIAMVDAEVLGALTRYLSLGPQDMIEEVVVNLLRILFSSPELQCHEAAVGVANQLQQFFDWVQGVLDIVWLGPSKRDRNPALEEDYSPPLQHRQRETRRPRDFERDGMDIMVRIHKLKQYFNQNSRDESKKRPMSLVNESQSSRSKDKKRSEQEMVVKKLCVSYMNDNNHLFSILLDEEATCSAFKASNLEIFPYNPTPNDSLLEGLCKEGLLESEKDDSKVGLVVIHTKVCESGVPTVGNMPVREIKVISGIPDQCQAGFMLENAGIFNIRWNIDADINGHWNFNNKTMIRATVIKSWALVNYSPSLSPTKVVDAYTLIGAISGFAEKLQNIFIPTVLSKTQTVLKELVPQGLDSQARQKRSWGTLPAVANSGAAGDLKPLLGSVKLDISNLVAFSRKFSLDGCNSRKSITALVELLKPMRGQQGAPPLALRPLTQIAKGNYANKIAMVDAEVLGALTRYLSLGPQDMIEEVVVNLLRILFSSPELQCHEAAVGVANQLQQFFDWVQGVLDIVWLGPSKVSLKLKT